MPRTGDSATRKRNVLMTWSQARRFLDARIVEMRQNILATFPDDPVAAAVALQVLNRKWKAGLAKLAAIRLTQKRRRGKLRAVHTVNARVGRREKTKPSHSINARIFRGKAQVRKARKRPILKPRHKSKRSRYRSHHRFNPRTGQGYQPIQSGPGRPRQVPEISKAKAKARDAKKERRRKDAVRVKRFKAGKEPYHKLTPERKKAIKATGELRHKATMAARKAWHQKHLERLEKNDGTRFADSRSNHHSELGYLTPHPRQRAKNGSRRHCHRMPKAGVGKKLLRAGLLVVRKIRSDLSRRRHLRGYWREVGRLRK